MNINSIAFCGDSFCAAAGPGTPEGTQYDSNYQYDWPYVIAQHFDAKITCTGIVGVNFYHSVQSLFGLHSHHSVEKPLNETDLVIFVVTEPHRVVNRDRLLMTYTWIDEISKGEFDDYDPIAVDLSLWSIAYQLAVNVISGPHSLRLKRFRKEPITIHEVKEACVIAKDYMDNVADWESQQVLQHALIMFVDERMTALGKRAIWFNAFSDSNKGIEGWCNKWQPKSGPMGDVPLYHLSTSEMNAKVMTNDMRRNHLSPGLNSQLAEMIIHKIKTDQLRPGTLHMKPWFDLE